MEQEIHVDPRSGTALDRVRLVSQAMSYEAPRPRLSSRFSSTYATVAF